MTSPFSALLGEWSGPSRLFLEGKTYDCVSTASVRMIARDRFVSIDYAWQVEDEPAEGLIIFPASLGATPVVATWLDSWHMSEVIMVCEASIDPAGFVALRGSYAAPPGPDWGWRLELGTEGGAFLLRMFNITPDGQEEIAVLAQYARA